ncbi:MAG: CAP domain-containing protein [Desulfobaccales bacterium]
MKSSWVKLMIVGLLAAALFIFCPQVMPLVKPACSPPVACRPQPVLPPPGIRYLEKVEDLVLTMTNQARQAKGVAPLSADAELRQVARAFSNDMLVRRFFDHTTPDGVDFAERITDQYPHRVFLVGENIWDAYGYSPANAQRLAQEIVADWMSSPGHRENLLSPAFTHLGVGVSARQHTIKATQEFVRKSMGFDWRGLLSPKGP